MPRVTEAEVQEIIETSVTVTPFISAANLTVTQHLSGKGLSSDLLKEIERWLAAHFAAMADPRVSQESVAGAAWTYEGQTGLGLDSTRYGQQAKLLDPTGTLAKLGAKRAAFAVLSEGD